MEKKRLIGAVTAAALASVSLAGCGGGTEKTDAGGADKPYEIQWYFIGNQGQTDMQSVETAINEYIKPKINATVKMNSYAWGTYENKVTMMLSSGEPLDLVFTAAGTLDYSMNAAKGAFLELDELLDKYGKETKEILTDSFLEGARINGKLYALPANKDKAHNFGFVYRTDLAEKYNFDMESVKSFEDLKPMLEVIKANEPEVTPLGMSGGRNPAVALDFDTVTYPCGMFPDAEDDKIINVVETEEYLNACKLAEQYFKAGYVRQDCAVSTNYGAIQKEGGFFISLEQCKPGKADELASASNGQSFGQIDITPSRTAITDATGSMMAIPRNCKNPDRVMQFLNLLYTDPVLNNLVVNGIENKHYIKKGENRIERINESGYSQAGYQWMFGNVMLNYLLPDEADDKYERLTEYNETAEPSRMLGFAFDSEPVRNELAAITNVEKEFRVQVETGSVNVEEYIKNYREKLKSAGIDKVIAEMQKQYDEWRAENK